MASSSASSRYNRRKYTKEEIARLNHCICKYPIYEQVSWTPENPGRRFKACPTRNKDKKCEVYGFLDDELPSQYYKDLMYKLYKDNQVLECNLESLNHPQDSDHVVAKNQNDDLPVELIYKELNDLKMKGKMYDMFLGGCICFMVLVLFFIVVIMVVSVRH